MARGADIRFRKGTAAAWTSVNPTLNDGELGVESDTRRMKLGNGAAAWAALPYLLATLPARAAPAVAGTFVVPHYITATAALAPTSGKLVAHFVDVGPGPMSISGLRFAVSGAMTAGLGAATEYAALYPDDGTGSRPNFTGGPVTSGSDTALAAGVRSVGGAATLQPGRYWTVALYVVGGTAPTAAATLLGASTTTPALPQTALGTPTRYLTHSTSFTALPTTQPAAAGWSYGADNAGVQVGLVAA